MIKEVENIVLWTYVTNDVNGEETVENFYGNKSQKANQKEFKRKRYKLFVKECNNLFNSWINKKHSINKCIFSTAEIFRRKSKS